METHADADAHVTEPAMTEREPVTSGTESAMSETEPAINGTNSAPTAAQSRALSIDDLVGLKTFEEVRISPSGKQVVYSVRSATVNRKCGDSHVWIAQIGKEYSAREVTDESSCVYPAFTPDEQQIAFTTLTAIYLCNIEGDGAIFPVTKVENKATIKTFRISSDGQHIAFTSPDEESPEQEERKKNGDDAKVYGEKWKYNRLRIVNLASRETATLFSEDAHVADFAWSPDSKEIAVITHEIPEYDSPYTKGVRFSRISLSTKACTPICHFPGNARDLTWNEHDGDLWFIGPTIPTEISTAEAIYMLSLSKGEWKKYSYGEKSSVISLKNARGTAVVHSERGLSSIIGPLTECSILERSQEILACDMLVLPPPSNRTIITLVLSTASQPAELYSCEDGLATQLSRHSSHIASLDIARTQTLRCKATDGTTDLEAIFVTPQNSPFKGLPWPAFVLVPGGPYSRVTEAFDLNYFGWSPWLASRGYAILSPNYLGSSGRGPAFASSAENRIGPLDYDDIVCTIKEAIVQGLVDLQRVMLGGYSAGGLFTALAVTRPPEEGEAGFKFRGAVCAGAITDIDSMVLTSDAWFYLANLARGKPWGMGVGETGTWHGSAVWHLNGVKEADKMPVLIMHGEEDEIMPAEQARGFHRGLMESGWDVEMVIYPNDDHDIDERAHRVDMLKRLERFVGRCIGSGRE